MVFEANGEVIGIAFCDTGEEEMIRPTVVALALCVVSSAQSMPYAPLQQPNNSVIQVRQGCGLGRQLVDGICVSNTKVRAAVRKCSARKMRMVNGRFPLPEKPGLGFELSEASLKRFPFGGTRPMARVFHEDGSVAEW